MVEEVENVKEESLSHVSISVEGNKVKELREEEVEIDTVYWGDVEQCYVHKSSMRFDPKDKRYYTWLDTEDDDDGDSRKLFYLPCNGNFKMAIRGVMGRNNRSVLEDKNWIEIVFAQNYLLFIIQSYSNCFGINSNMDSVLRCKETSYLLSLLSIFIC